MLCYCAHVMSTQNPGPWWRRLPFLSPHSEENSNSGELKKGAAEVATDIDAQSRLREPQFGDGERTTSRRQPLNLAERDLDSPASDSTSVGDEAEARVGSRRIPASSSEESPFPGSESEADHNGVTLESSAAYTWEDTEMAVMQGGEGTHQAPSSFYRYTNNYESLRNSLSEMTVERERTRVQLEAAEARLEESATQLRSLREMLQKQKLRTDEANARTTQVKETLTERASRVSQQNEKLKSSVLALQAKVVAANERTAQTRQVMNERLERRSSQILKLKEALQEQRSRTVTAHERVLETKNLLAERSAILKQRLSDSREKLTLKTNLYNVSRRYYAVYRQGLLLDEALKSDVDFGADAYLCLLPSTVPAGLTLSKIFGGRVYCDCVENVEVHKHSLAPNVHKPTLELINLAAFGSLMSVDGIMTVGNALARTLSKFGPPVHVAPNFRRFEEPAPANELREACGLSGDEKLLFASGNVVVGFEPVIRALAELPEDVHLAAFVKLKPIDYENEMLALIDELELTNRIHFFDFVPYEKLASIAADADVGMITSDVTNPNGAVALPNRLFDYVTAGLPVIAPPMPDVVDIVLEHEFGVTLERVTTENWVEAIQTVLADLDRYRKAAVEARKTLNWENGEDDIVEFLGNPRSVTLLGFRDISRYQRFLRITQALTSRGIHVKALFLSDDPAPVPFAEAEFFSFSDRYGLGNGPVRVRSGEA